ncbi:MAG: hypothetical protein JXR73_07830 [Candidatus Omnitrophica bacterium]|nr:hypothetical protein [Candidatus Omnitrophota bacterium]
MKTIRTLILLAIIFLVALAFLTRSPENPEQQDIVEAFLAPLQELQQAIEEQYPELRSDLEELKSDIRGRVAGLDPKNLIPVQSFAQSSSPADLTDDATASATEAQDAPEINPELENEINNLAENLREMDSDELAQRIQAIYEKLQQRVETRDAPTATPEN